MPFFGFFKSRLKHLRDVSEFTQEQCDTAQSLYLEALDFDDAGDQKNAIDKYTAALKIIPVFWEALDNRGLCHMRLHDFASAIDSFELSTQINNESPLALVALIKCYRETKQSGNAFHVTQYCTTTWPDKSPFPDWDSMLGPSSA